MLTPFSTHLARSPSRAEFAQRLECAAVALTVRALIAGLTWLGLSAAAVLPAEAAPALHGDKDPLFTAAPDAPAFPQQTQRPSMTGGAKLETEHFVVHYLTRGGHAPDLTDSDGNGHPDYVDKVAAAYEWSWDIQQNQLGWAPPPTDQRRGGDDRYDVYIQNFALRGASGVLGQAVPEPVCGDNPFTAARERNACPGFTIVAHNLGNDYLIRQVSAHEWQHQVQFGYVSDPNWSVQEFMKVIWLYESSSKWMDQFQFEESRVPTSQLRCFMQNPDLNMNAGDSPNCGAIYRYAPFIFIQFLAERFSPTTVRTVWERAATERIFDEAIWKTIVDEGETFPEVWRDFSEALWTMADCGSGTRACFQRGPEYGAVAQITEETRLVLGPVSRTYSSRTHGNGRLDGQSADYIGITTQSPFEAKLLISANTANFGFMAVYRHPTGAFESVSAQQEGRELVMRLPPPESGGRLVLVLANGSQTSLNDYTLTLNPLESLPDPTPTEPGPSPTDPPIDPTPPPDEPTPTNSPEPTGTPDFGAGHRVLLPWAGNKGHVGRGTRLR